MTSTDQPEQRRWSTWIGLVLFSLVVRGGVLIGGWQQLDRDPDGYRQLATNLVNSGTFGYEAERDGQLQVVPTAFRPPLYPLLLATIGLVHSTDSPLIAAVHLAMGMATILLLYGLACRHLDQRLALIAAVLLTVDPILLNQSTLVMTETFATFLTMLVWWRLDSDRHRIRPMALRTVGILIGLAVLCRPTFLIWLVFIAIALLYQVIRERQWAGWLAICLGASVMIAPWCVRNFRQFGEPIVATTHGGYTLWLGNNPAFYRFLRESDWGAVWDSTELDASYNAEKAALGFDEVAADRWARQQAMQCIHREPGTFVYACLVRVGRLWGLVPHQLSPHESHARRFARYAVGGWYAGLFLLAVFGLYVRRRNLLRTPWIWGLLLCLSFTAVHCFYWSNLRMRAPLMPVVCLVAAAGLGDLISRKYLLPFGLRQSANP